MKPSSSLLCTSARARESPAASRSENSASSCTGDNIEPASRQASNVAMPSASTAARITVPPEGAPKSNMLASPAFLPALNARPRTTKIITPFSRTNVQMVELNRDFMTPPKLFPGELAGLGASPNDSNTWPRKHFEQSPQVNDQRQPVVVPQHADAVRHIFRRLLEQIIGVHRIRPDHLVGGYSQPQIFVMTLATPRRHDHVLRQQPRPASLRHRDVNQRHDGAAQIEYSHQVRRTQRHLRHQRPVQHFFHIQHRQTESFPSAAEYAVLRFRRTLFNWAQRFEQLARVGVRWKWCQVELFVHPSLLSRKPLRKSPHGAQQIFPRERLGDVSVRALLLAPEPVARRVLRSHHNHRDALELHVALQVPANLESVSLRHDYVQQDHHRPHRLNRFLDELRVAQPNGAIAFALQQALDQLHLRWRVIHDQYSFQLSHAHSMVLHRPEVHVGSQLPRFTRLFASSV